jgi:eukaryotic-like serine/threonine-protein kinase
MVNPLRFCDQCGAANNASNKFCAFCGNQLQGGKDKESELLGSTLKQRYEVLTVIGQGGFGTIYKAEDLVLNRALRAIKEMRVGNLDKQEQQQAIAAFQREASMLAGLMHPHLPRIYDHFEDQGHWYLVMDFIEGETLEERLQKLPGHALPVPLAITYALQLCNVLHYLHTRQPAIIFRDLKPANIMVSSEDDHFYLIDFGIARLFKPGQMKDTLALGSPGYAAPEQYGKAQTAQRADIYALGATLHTMLSGRDPGDEPFQFPPLLLPGYPYLKGPLNNLISRMVEMNRDRRPENALLVKQELLRIEQIMTGQQFPGLLSAGAQFISSPSGPQTVGAQIIGSSGPITQAQGYVHSRATLFPSAVTPPALPISALKTIYKGHQAEVKSIQWSSSETYIVSRDNKLDLHAWNIQSGERYLGGLGRSATCSPGGSLLARALATSIEIFDTKTWRTVREWHQIPRVANIYWSPDGRYILATEYEERTISIFDAVSGQVVKRYTGHKGGSLKAAWSPDGTVVASGGTDQEIHLWHVGQGQPFLTYQHGGDIEDIAWSPDSNSIASIGAGLHVWDATSGKTVQVYGDGTDLPHAVDWAPDSKRIVCAGYEDGTIELWRALHGEFLSTYQGHKRKVLAVAWSPSGQWIASGGEDQVVQIWQAQ